MYDMQSFIAKELIEILKQDDSVYILVVDGWECYYFNSYKQYLTKSQLSRIINMGIQEQNAVGFAAGLALVGKRVYLVMFAAFLTARAFEQIKLDIGYNNANVKLIGIHSGFTGPKIAGYSHWAIEDLAIMQAVPNLKIFSPSANINEMKQIFKIIKNDNSPTYLRVDNPGEYLNKLDYQETLFDYGISTVLKEDYSQVAILATGNMVKEAIDICKDLNPHIKLSLYSIFLYKPFNYKFLDKILSKNIPIITIEEHTRYGGLSSIVSEQIATKRHSAGFTNVCIKDKKYNLVLGDYRYAIDKLLGTRLEIINSILMLTYPNNTKKGAISGIRLHFDTKGRYSKDIIFLKIPLIKIKTFKKNRMLYKSYYICGIKIMQKRAYNAK